jgi:hypothetical protein
MATVVAVLVPVFLLIADGVLARLWRSGCSSSEQD